MNNQHQENGALTGPLIFTVPAYGFVMALYVDWLGRSTRATVSAKTFAEEVEPSPRDLCRRSRAVKNLILFPTKV
jgi:hypothetical protein